MHARIRKMLDFLGSGSLGVSVAKAKPRSFRRYLELVNVSTGKEEVK
jgi:hypothetical protein